MLTGLGLGSNLGDRLAQLQRARQFLASLSRHLPLAVSPLFETQPLDCPAGSQSFLNAVIEIDCDLAPQELLRRLKQFERTLGRDLQAPRNAPRPIDLDILYMDQLELHEPDLVLPHPRLAQRRFVLEPLAALRPALRLPGLGGTVAELLALLPPNHGEVTLRQTNW